MPLAGAPPSLFKHPLIFLSMFLLPFRKTELANLKAAQVFNSKGSGYSKIQSTKPQTLAYALSDSPVGVLAWIYEKLVAWTDDYPWTDDERNHHTHIIISFLLMKSDSPIMGLYLLVLQAWTCGLCSHLLRSCPDRRAVC